VRSFLRPSPSRHVDSWPTSARNQLLQQTENKQCACNEVPTLYISLSALEKSAGLVKLPMAVEGKVCGGSKTNLEEKWIASTSVRAIVYSIDGYIITHVHFNTTLSPFQ
jgi:hypothetical protein